MSGSSASNKLNSKQVVKRQVSVEQFLTTLELDFNMGKVDLGVHGEHELRGSLPIFKEYIQPNLEQVHIVDEKLQEWVRKVQVPWTKDEISGPNSYIKTAIAATAYFNPKDPITEEAMIAAAGFCLCIIYLDDILDKSGSFGGTSTNTTRRRNSLSSSSPPPRPRSTPKSSNSKSKNSSKSNKNEFSNVFLNTVFDILNGKFKSVDELPKIIPSLDPIYQLLCLSFNFGIRNLPSYSPENSKHLREAFLNDSIAALLMKDPKYGDCYSDEVYRLLRPRDGGFYSVLELLLLGRGIIIENSIRKHPIFKIIMFLSGSALGFTNDLFGLEKEVKDGNDNDNLVLRQVRNEGMSIIDSFTKVNAIIRNQRKDIELSCDKLLDEFANDENLEHIEGFIDVLQTFLDGHVYFSQHTSRYGSFTLTLRNN